MTNMVGKYSRQCTRGSALDVNKLDWRPTLGIQYDWGKRIEISNYISGFYGNAWVLLHLETKCNNLVSLSGSLWYV